MVKDRRDKDRVARLLALPQADREALVRTVGEAALDLWSLHIEWPDLIERCIEAAEEDIAAGRVPVRPQVGPEADARVSARG